MGSEATWMKQLCCNVGEDMIKASGVSAMDIFEVCFATIRPGPAISS